MKTRAELKKELNGKVPLGEEQVFLSETETSLSHARSNLHDLRSRRAQLMRQISVRQRKLHDWKGKIPRSNSNPTCIEAERELERLGNMPTHRVATVFDKGDNIIFSSMYRRALRGLDGFSHIWVMYMAEELTESICMGFNENHLHFQLCKIQSVNETTGKIIFIDNCLPLDAAIIDVKPYLRYCESWATNDTTKNDNSDIMMNSPLE